MALKTARIENGIVQAVLVGTVEWATINLGGEWVDVTGLNCGVGFTFDGTTLKPPQPYPSWVFDDEINGWNPPVPYPADDGKMYQWDEQSLSWVETLTTGE